MLHNYKKVLAFTLAEVLITLGIIGVVAAMTIPTLIKNYQKTQYVVGYKKAYSEFQQMLKSYMVDENIESLDQTALFTQDGDQYLPDSTIRQANLDNMIKKYFKVAKVCKPGDSSCEISEADLGDPKTLYTAFYRDNYNFCTVEGICFEVFLYPHDNCVSDSSNYGNMKGTCLDIAVDMNGKKGPNIQGRDYQLNLLVAPDGNIYPYGGMVAAQYYGGEGSWADVYWKGDQTECGLPNNPDLSNAKGNGCSGRIIDEGWQMNY